MKILVSCTSFAMFTFLIVFRECDVVFADSALAPFRRHVQVAPKYLATHVDRLLKALLVCFFDESWPVRDAACVASGRFAGAYPEECRPSLDQLYERCCFWMGKFLVGQDWPNHSARVKRP